MQNKNYIRFIKSNAQFRIEPDQWLDYPIDTTQKTQHDTTQHKKDTTQHKKTQNGNIFF